MKNHHEILKRVIEKGGLFGACASLYANDEKMATQYILELSEQTHIGYLRCYWGATLSKDIKQFAFHYKPIL